MIVELIRTVKDRLSLPRDDSREAASGLCDFTPSEIAAAPAVETAEPEDDD